MNATTLTHYLITHGLTFNAEVPTDPVITRPVRIEVLVNTIMECLNEQDQD